MKKIRINRKRIVYYALKLARQSGTPECIAKGVFLGLFIGFLIPMGGQIIIVLALAFIFKANKIVSCAFTMVTNHFTVLIIYPFQCVLGSYVIANPMTWDKVYGPLINALKAPGWWEKIQELWLLGEDFIIPFFVGGMLLAVVSSIPGYFISLYIVRNLRNRHAARKLAKSKLANQYNQV